MRVYIPWLTKISIPDLGFIHTSHFPLENLPQMCHTLMYWTSVPIWTLQLRSFLVVAEPTVCFLGSQSQESMNGAQQLHQSNP